MMCEATLLLCRCLRLGYTRQDTQDFFQPTGFMLRLKKCWSIPHSWGGTADSKALQPLWGGSSDNDYIGGGWVCFQFPPVSLPP